MPELLRPQPRLNAPARRIDRNHPVAEVVARLRDGESLQVGDRWSTGVAVLTALQEAIGRPPQDAPYAIRRRAQRALDDATGNLWAPVQDGALALERAPSIGWLAELYPERGRLWVQMEDLRRMLRAWDVYQQGAHLAVLGHPLHPLWGTYVPRRTEHLELFATWLAGWTGARDVAIDVGCGCGVLGLMLCRGGFARVVATDDNPNAVESVRRDLARLEPPPALEPVDADLLGTGEDRFDLIVFNPPWIPGAVRSPLDRALYFEPGLLARFFEQAHERLASGGRVVVLFSDVMTLVTPDEPHPIEAELARGRFRLVEKLRRRVKPSRTRDGRLRKTRERVEVWELERLTSV